MTEQFIPGSCMARPIFQTYAHKPDRLYLVGTFSGTNSGFFGYLGGLLYLYWNVVDGVIQVKVRNYADQAYPTAAISQGNFSFNYNSVVGIQAQIYTANTAVTSNQHLGVLCNLDVADGMIQLYPFTSTSGTVTNYTLGTGDAVHLELVIQKNTTGGTYL